jgi:hypothetical protein
MSLRLAVVFEHANDFATATELADRVLAESVDWLDDDLLSYQRTWIGDIGSEGLTWAGVKKLARKAGIDALGHFRGKPGEPDAVAALRAIRYLRFALPELAAVMLIRDQDNQPLRRVGLEQARGEVHDGFPIIVGLAVLMREAWILSGFDPEDDDEHARLRATRQRLGLDPRTRSHDVSDPKRALHELTAGDRARERRCWVDPSLPTLRERGVENGLAAYLDDVRDRLAGLFGRAA